MMNWGCVMWNEDNRELESILNTLSPKGRLLMAHLLRAKVRCDECEVTTLKRVIVGCWSNDLRCLEQIERLGGGVS